MEYFGRAKTAKESYQNAEAQEKTDIAKATNEIDSHVDGNRDTVTISKEEYTRLLNASNSMNFSTEEKVVGTWIDGKPLYQKTYQKSISKITSSNRQWIEVFKVGDDTESIDHIHIDYGASYIFNGANYIYPTAHTAAGACYFTLRISNTGVVDFVIENKSWLDEGDNQLLITVLYTKTTD